MSTVKADYLVNAAGTGAPTFSNGIVSSVAIPLSSGGTGATSGAGAFANLMGYTSTATNAGATNLTNTSTQYQLFTGTLVQTIRLPTTSTLTTGWTFHIVNNSTANLTVNATGSSFVCTVLPGMTAMLTCISTAVSDNTAWEFGFTDFGSVTGTGSAVLSAAPSLTGNLSFDSGYGSSAVAYGCRAWVNFNGSSGAIRASGNVTSVSRTAVGTYTVNLTTAMPDANYSAIATCDSVSSTPNLTTLATSAFGLNTRYATSNTSQDKTIVTAAVFR